MELREREKVKRNTIVCDMEKGGLKMVNLKAQMQALKIKWISRIFSGDENTKWKKIFKYWYKSIGGLSLVLEFNCEENDVKDFASVKMPEFYKQVWEAWYVLQNLSNTKQKTTNLYEDTIIWCNTNVRHKGKVLHFGEWIKAGIIYMKDIVADDRILNLSEIEQIIRHPILCFCSIN